MNYSAELISMMKSSGWKFNMTARLGKKLAELHQTRHKLIDQIRRLESNFEEFPGNNPRKLVEVDMEFIEAEKHHKSP
jgi:hypothetical protein